MKMDVSDIAKPLITFIKRSHTLIFFLLVSIGLAAAILTLVTIVNTSGSVSNQPNNSINGAFDEDIINKIGELGQGKLTQPGNNRSSPFTEPTK